MNVQKEHIAQWKLVKRHCLKQNMLQENLNWNMNNHCTLHQLHYHNKRGWVQTMKRKQKENWYTSISQLTTAQQTLTTILLEQQEENALLMARMPQAVTTAIIFVVAVVEKSMWWAMCYPVTAHLSGVVRWSVKFAMKQRRNTYANEKHQIPIKNWLS